MLTFCASQNIKAQSNLNFESWSGNDPQSWTSSNTLTTSNGGDQTVFKETTDPAGGTASLKLVTGACPDCPTYLSDNSWGLIDCTFPNPFGGTVQLGSFMEPSIPYNKRPLSIDIKYKSKPVNGDAGVFYMALTKYNSSTGETDDVGYAYFEANTTVTSWTSINIPVVYYSTDIPDTMNMYASSSVGTVMDCHNSMVFPGMPDPYGNTGTGWNLPYPQAGSEFYLDDIIINLPSCASLAVAMSGTTESGVGMMDGSATATGSGGTAPYTYLWSTGETTQTISGLTKATYMVVITDANGCQKTGQYIVTNPGCNIQLSMSGTKTSTNSIYTGTGAITATTTDGGSYNFYWNTGNETSSNTSSTISNLPIGSYAVLVEDASNAFCATWGYYVILGPNSPTTSVEAQMEKINDINVFPNPTNDKIFLAGNDISHVAIYSIDGKKVYETDVNNAQYAIELKNKVDQGTYIVRISRSSGNQVVKKITVN